MRRLVPLVAALIALAWLAPGPCAADVTMTARSLAGGNVRVGAWSAIEVDVANDGPAISGELRLASDQAASSSYAALVDLPTGSRKRYVLYAQPSHLRARPRRDAGFGRGDRSRKADVPITAHDQYQSVIGVVAEEPGPLVAALTSALADPRVAAPAIVSLAPEDLPARVEAWSAIDRLVWQDVDTAQASAGAACRAAHLAGTRRPSGHPGRLDGRYDARQPAR